MSATADRLVSRVTRVRVLTRMGNSFVLDDVKRLSVDTHSTTVVRHEYSTPSDPNEDVAVWEDTTILYHDELKSITLVFDTPHHEYGESR